MVLSGWTSFSLAKTGPCKDAIFDILITYVCTKYLKHQRINLFVDLSLNNFLNKKSSSRLTEDTIAIYLCLKILLAWAVHSFYLG